MKNLISNEIESLDELDGVEKRIVIISFLTDLEHEELQNICESFTMTRALLLNLLNIKNNGDDILFVERSVVEEIFSMKINLLNAIFAQALTDAEENQNKV